MIGAWIGSGNAIPTFGSVGLLRDEAFCALFYLFTHAALRLEVQGSCHAPNKVGRFDLSLTGQADDSAWHRSWLNLVQEGTSAGKNITHARVVNVPYVDYTRWGLTVAPLNIVAGEDVRWIPRHLINADALATDDYGCSTTS